MEKERLEGEIRWGGERKAHTSSWVLQKATVSGASSSCGGEQSTLWAEGPCVWSGCLGAAGQSSWGVRTQSKRLWPILLPPAVFTELHAGKPLPNWSFWKKIKFLRAFWHPLLLTGTSANWVFKWKHWNILQRPKQLGRKYDPMKGPAYWINSISSGVR